MISDQKVTIQGGTGASKTVDVETRGTKNVLAIEVLDPSGNQVDLTDGSQKTQIVDGSGNVIGATGNALDMNIKSGSVTLIASDIEIGAVELKNGTDDTRATITAQNALKVDGSGVTQPISGTVQPGNTANTTPWLQQGPSSTRGDTYTATGNGTTVNLTANPLQTFGVQVKGTGAAATTWDVRLEGSLDGTNFTQILQHTNTTGDGAIVFSGASYYPSLYFRSRCSGLVLGSATNIVVTILGLT